MNINFDKTLIKPLRDNIFDIHEQKMSNICKLINGCKIKAILRKKQQPI